MSRTFERLSTGQRINRASDDAAGLAIADSLRVRSRLYGAANRNINDALSMLNIADGTLSNQTDILIRLRELAEQSANGVFSSAQRETMNREYLALTQEFARLGESASFNGISLLNSEGSVTNFQVGIDGRATSNISLTSASTGLLSGVFDLDDNPEPENFTSSGTLAEITSAFNNHLWRTNWVDGSGQSHEVLVALRRRDAGYGETVRIEIYARSSEVGSPGQVTIGSEVIEATDEWSLAARTNLLLDPATGQLTPGESLNYSLKNSSGSIEFNLDLSRLRVLSRSETGKQQSILEFTGIENIGRARDALTILGRRLDELSTLRGTYGATQSRLQTALATSTAMGENSQAAESRIREIDVAAESARLVSLQILQQAAASVLASANQQPQLLLNLLRSG